MRIATWRLSRKQPYVKLERQYDIATHITFEISPHEDDVIDAFLKHINRIPLYNENIGVW